MANQTDLKQTIKNLRIACSILIVILLIGAIVLSVGFGVYGKNTDDWFKKQEQQAEQLPDDGEQEGGQLIETIECQGVTLLSSLATTASDGSVTKELTASVQPVGAEGGVNWSIEFANPSSTWAKGKALSDYVTYAIKDDTHGKTIVITNTQPFGEQIIIKATSIADDTKVGTCTLDYEKRMTGFTVAISEKTAGSVTAINFDEKSALEYTFTPTAQYGVGTITPTGTWNYTYKFTDEFANALYYNYQFMSVEMAGYVRVDSNAVDMATNLQFSSAPAAAALAHGMSSVSNGKGYSVGYCRYYMASSIWNGTYSDSVASSLISYVAKAIKNYSGNVLEFSCEFTSSNGNSYSGKLYAPKGTANVPSLNVSSVNMSASNLIF